MFELTRIRVLTLVRASRVAQMTIVVGLFLAIGTIAYYAKTIDACVDGKRVHITTFFGTVGQALAHSNLHIYPEDIVTPSRDTKITKGMTVEVTRSVPVHLSVDEQSFVTRTTAKTVEDALVDLSKRYGLRIKEYDEVNVPRSASVTDQMEIKVKRAIPILVSADGETKSTYIAPRTVADALKKLGIVLGKMDKVSLPLDHMLTANEQVHVVRVAERIETVKSEVPFQIVIQPGDYPVGLPDKIISRGSDGLQEQTVRLTLEDGKEVDRQILGQRVVLTPTNQVVSRGVQTSISRGGDVINFKRAYVMTATAYCEPGGITATGSAVHWGIAAVDPRVISLGKSVYVEGYGEARALDTGGAIIGNRIDLYMNSQEAAAAWGVRKVLVYEK